MGKEEKALGCLRKLEEKKLSEKGISCDIPFAIIYSGLRNYEKVFYYLEKAYNERQGSLIFIKNRPWKETQKDPRFKTLLDKMGLPFKIRN